MQHYGARESTEAPNLRASISPSSHQKIRHPVSNAQTMRRISRYHYPRAHTSNNLYSHPSITLHSSVWGWLTNGSTVRHNFDGPEAFGKVNYNYPANLRFISSEAEFIKRHERRDLVRLQKNNWSLTPDETGLEKSFEFRTFRDCWVCSTIRQLSFSIIGLISRR